MTPFMQARFTQARAAGFAAALSVLMLGSAAPAQTILQATIGEPNQKTAEVSTTEVRRILADGSASGRYVFGDRIETWREGLASVPVRLEVDGALRREGIGADVMGNPLRPLWWLAEQRRQWGDGLRAGETISTGSMTGMLPIRAGQHVRARFGDVATIEITIDL